MEFKLRIAIDHGAEIKQKINIQNSELSLLDFVNNNNLISKYPSIAENLIIFLINEGLNGKHEGKDSMLFYQYCSCDISVISNLIEIGYNINKTYRNNTPLMKSIESNNFDSSITYK